MKVLFIHPTGNKNSRVILESLAQKGFLTAYFTGFAVDKNLINLDYLPKSIKKLLSFRSYDHKIHCRTHSAFLPGLVQIIAYRFLSSNLIRKFSVNFLFDSVDNNAEAYLRKSSVKPDLVIFHSGCGLKTAKTAKQLSIPVVMELPICHIQYIEMIYSDLRHKYPAWKRTIPLVKRYRQIETQHIDAIVCPSQFVYDSIPKPLKNNVKCYINYYGFEKNVSIPKFQSKDTNSLIKTKLSILFVGQLTQRKGIADIFKLVKLLDKDKFAFTFIGQPMTKLSFYKKQCPNAYFAYGLSRDEVLAKMSESDVFLFPTYAEGRALVVLEALSVGLPVITSNNAGFDDININNNYGYIVKPGDIDAISDLLLYLEKNRDKLAQLRSNILNNLGGTNSWSDFANNYLEFLKEQVQ